MSHAHFLVSSTISGLISIQYHPNLVQSPLTLASIGNMDLISESTFHKLISNFLKRPILIQNRMYVAQGGDVPESIFHINADAPLVKVLPDTAEADNA